MASKHATIHDVAKRAGVSKSLVSLVMRGATNVSDESRAAVLAAAKELGYRPNLAARSLARRRSQILGILVSDLHNPFFNEIIDGIDEVSVDRDYRPVITTGQLVASRERDAIEMLLELRVDGLMLLGPQVPRAVIAEVGETVPTVAVGLNSRAVSFDSIAGDERVGVQRAIDHLVELGHSHIAHVHGGSGAGARPRRRAYERHMKRHGLEEYITVASGDYTRAGGRRGMARLLELPDRPTAVFMANDFSAMGALEVLDNEGISVPGEMSIVGYDNLEAATLNRIQLTTIDQPRLEMGRTATQMLIERIDDGRTESRHVVLPPTLVTRSTAGPPA